MNGKHAAPTARRSVTVLATALALTAVSGTAYAYWTTTGTGTGSAAATKAEPLTTVSAVVSPAVLLHPGSPAADVVVRVANPNPFDVVVTTVVQGTGAVTASGVSTSCTTTGVTFVAPQGGLPLTVPAKSQAETVLKQAAKMDGTSETGCQGATFSLPLSITAETR